MKQDECYKDNRCSTTERDYRTFCIHSIRGNIYKSIRNLDCVHHMVTTLYTVMSDRLTMENCTISSIHLSLIHSFFQNVHKTHNSQQKITQAHLYTY